MFDKQWFEKHQRVVIVLLNLPLAGLVFRRLLWIDEYVYPVVKITPTAVHVWTGKGKYRTTIYSNAQYAEAMHRSFGWLWSLFHAWDMLINPLQPQWNLGFDTYTSQPDDASGQDAQIMAVNPNTNYGSATICESASLTDVVTLIKFDFSSIPSNASCTSGSFYYTNSGTWWGTSGATCGAMQIWRMTRAWTEACTWNKYDGTNNWGTAGARATSDSDETTQLCTTGGTYAAPTSGQPWPNDQRTITLTPSEIEKLWNGTYTNHGLKISGNTEGTGTWASCEHATASYRPKMVINYTAAVPSGFFAFF